MHGEELVVLLRRQKLDVRPSELDPEDQRLDSADHQEGKGGDDIAKPNLLMVHRRQPADQAGLGLP